MAPARSSARGAMEVTLAGIALILVAFTFDAGPLFVCGAGLTLIGVATPAWIWLTARGARAERALHAERVVEGQPLEARIDVRRGPLGLPGAQLHDPLAQAEVSLARGLALVGGARCASVRVIARFERRGEQHLPPPRLIARDPLELARIVRTSEAPSQRVLVLPRTEPVSWLLSSGAVRPRSQEGDAPSDLLAAVNLDGLRPYRPGTPASRIHWSALARGAGLLERRLQADGDARPLVVLDGRGGEPIELLDAAVRAAASLALELARAGGCTLLLPGQRRVIGIDSDLLAWPAAHARLALVKGGPDTRAPALSQAGARRGPVFYVAAQPLERLPALLARLTRAPGMLVLPTASLSAGGLRGAGVALAPVLEVTGCRGFLLGARRRAGAHEARSAA